MNREISIAVLRITWLEANRWLLTKHREVEFGKADDKSRRQGTERDYNKEHLYAKSSSLPAERPCLLYQNRRTYFSKLFFSMALLSFSLLTSSLYALVISLLPSMYLYQKLFVRSLVNINETIHTGSRLLLSRVADCGIDAVCELS